jgi:hypothetical protein
MAGRKNKYESHVKPYLDKIPRWRRDGMTEKQICEKLDITEESLNQYKKRYTELTESLKTGKAELVESLKDSLYRRAMGYEYEETKTTVEKDDQGKDRKKIEKNKKMIFSDTCLIFALKNIDPENFKDRKDVKADINAKIQNMTIDIVDDEGSIIDFEEGFEDENKV